MTTSIRDLRKARGSGRPGSTSPEMQPRNSVVALLFSCRFLCGQSAPEPIKLGSMNLSGSVRSRIEAWQWFKPDAGDPDCVFSGNLLRLNLTRPGKTFDWTIELASPIL